VAVFVVVGGEEPLAEGACIGEGAEPVGEVGHIFEGLELGLRVRVVIEHRGREWERRTPRSIIISDTGFDVIDPPRSAWMVCGTTMLAATAPARKSFATTASSAFATSQPVTYREKMSSTT
jgi:hypothetical protein